MLAPYRAVLAHPGALAFVLAAAVARLPMSMLAIGAIFLIEEATGSYAIAGAVAATVGIAQATCGPLLGRVVDRLGQRAVLVPSIAVHVVALLALIAAADADAPRWVLFVTAAVAGGAVPLMTSMVRARWSHALGGSPQLQSAFALESVIDEVVYIVGPVVVAVLATQVSPSVAMATTVLFTAGGGLAFAAQRATEPPRRGTAGERHRAAVSLPPVRVVVVAFVAMGVVFGTVEVAMVAFADQRDVPVAAGLLLAVLSLASLIAGLGYGAARWRRGVDERFRWITLAFALSTLPLALAPGIVTMAVAAALAGGAFAPTLISGFELIERAARGATLTEALAWLTSGINVGAAGGAAAAGRVAEHAGARDAFLVAVGAGVICAAASWTGRRRLRPAPA